MADSKIVDVGADFSLTPGGRFADEGEFSGEEFRTTKLEPLLDAGFSIVVDLDQPMGFTTSFLEEAFGGLVRRYGAEVMERVTLRATARPQRAEKAREFMRRALLEAGATTK
jgi:hypothetical protein